MKKRESEKEKIRKQEEEKSISTLTRPVNYIRSHSVPFGNGPPNCMQTKQRSKAYCYQAVKRVGPVMLHNA